MKYKAYFLLMVPVLLVACSPDYPVLPPVSAKTNVFKVSDATSLQVMNDQDVLQSELGALVKSHACSDALKTLGSDIAKSYDEHRKTLIALAATHHLNLSATLSPGRQTTVPRLSKLYGRPFDRSYLKAVKLAAASDRKRLDAIVTTISDSAVKAAAVALNNLDQTTIAAVEGWSAGCARR